MAGELTTALAKAAADLLKEVYGDLAKPGVTQVGKALGAILGLGNTVLWPVYLVNEKARLLLEANMERYRAKLAETPVERVVEVPPEIGVPVLEKLGFVRDPDLAELYANLLASASDEQTQAWAHPAFAKVIDSISPDEARLLEEFGSQLNVPFVRVRFFNPEVHGKSVEHSDLNTRLLKPVALVYPENYLAYMSNLQGLGLVAIDRSAFSDQIDRYENIERTLADAHLQDPDRFREFTKREFERGLMRVTRFGRLFLKACTRTAPTEPEAVPG